MRLLLLFLLLGLGLGAETTTCEDDNNGCATEFGDIEASLEASLLQNDQDKNCPHGQKLVDDVQNNHKTCVGIRVFQTQVCKKFKENPLGNNDCEICTSRDKIDEAGVNRCEGLKVTSELTLGSLVCTQGDVMGLKNPDTGVCIASDETSSFLNEKNKDLQLQEIVKGEASIGVRPRGRKEIDESWGRFSNKIDESIEVEIGESASSSGEWTIEELTPECGPLPGFDPTGTITCNDAIYAIKGLPFNFWTSAMDPIRCYTDESKSTEWSTGDSPGRCYCEPPKKMGTDGSCYELTCEASSSGPACHTCVSPLTRNNECETCNEGYILRDGDCLESICTEDPNSWQWKGCQECRALESRRHAQDCLICAHGYHFLHEQNITNAKLSNTTTSEVTYSSESLWLKGQESGYCFPYTCIAGGNLENAQTGIDFGEHNPDLPYDPDQRTIKITPIISTDQNALADGVPALSPSVLSFRDHCKSCVPQQMREKDDHCETCNSGYYLDEMHHTCRKKTCGVPHFRRNAVSCTEKNLVPKPWSTPCTACEDNSYEGEDSCCVFVAPDVKVMTCGANGVFCYPGTHKTNFDSIDCSADGCKHYSELCCDPKTCFNQKVGCRPDQDKKYTETDGVVVFPVCSFCTHGHEECCEDKTQFTCGMKNVKCGANQKHRPASTSCSSCINDALECCEPMTKTCQNQGVFCHAGTHKAREDSLVPVVCTFCENYGEECCEKTTCSNQRVGCAAGREHKGDVDCTDCIPNTEECCEPLKAVGETCGNQLVKCEPRLFRPAVTECDVEDGTCNDYGETCCFPKTCGNQEVGCSVLQAPLDKDTPCSSCADNGDECCTDKRTCGLLGVQCKLGGYLSPLKTCNTCAHFATGEDECCTEVGKTCSNQGVVCLPGTHQKLGIPCEDCLHYEQPCCVEKTCGNQQVGCSRGRERKGDDIECDDCYFDSDDCCEPLERTCATMSVKCRDGHYKANQAEINCGRNCTNYVLPCCVPFEKTCGNQNVVCSSDQTYESPDTGCTDCVNRGSECCLPADKTCANQGIVCRPGYQVDEYATTICDKGDDEADNGNCLNDAAPCCKPYKKTCGNQNVVCSAQQTYKPPTTECTSCVNHDSKCCTDIPKTCSNQRVVCRAGHYHDEYKTLSCTTCYNDDTNECCKSIKKTCGNQNVQCSKTQTPRDTQTVCQGEECKNNSETCCLDVDSTCGNQSVVCRPGHYVVDYNTTSCSATGCLNDAKPCCIDFKATCGNQNIRCGPDQKYRDHDTECNGSCANYGGTCCIDVAHTCGNQGIICRPGYYVEGHETKSCSETGCIHHAEPCCTTFEKTCGNQKVVCSAGQTYKKPSETCSGCYNGGEECCSPIAKTCQNQQVVCRPGHYADSWSSESCTECKHDASPCCTEFKTTCGNMNVKCDSEHTPREPTTECDGDECKNNSATCCLKVNSTCANQNVVCRPGYYIDDYNTTSCAGTGCLNDQAPCCKEYFKTCQNQGVICTLGLMKHINGGDQRCTTCDNYDTKECCEPITKTCGNSGVACRQDLYKPLTTECKTCNATECCNEIPPPPTTCANSLYECKSKYYKPRDFICPDGKCTDDICCLTIEPTCGNQNVQCHENTYKSSDTPCGLECDHYGEKCCDVLTCKKAGVDCDLPYFEKVNTYDTESCANKGADCQILNNAAPCCLPMDPKATAPTCGNKYGIQEDDKDLFPFLIHWKQIPKVSCDASKGWYKRLNADGSTLDNTPCSMGNYKKETMWSACQDNDMQCCWRKTCAPMDVNSVENGYYNGAEGPVQDDFATITCKAGYQLKEHPEYIVCQGDCQADCCEKIPDDATCLSERVACSHGYERKEGWETQKCEIGCDEENSEKCQCVENSALCCQRKTCTQVTCNTNQTHLTGHLCFDCLDNGEECCEPKPIQKTCSNQRVFCAYGYFKHGLYETSNCTNCYDNGEECCHKKKCGARGINDVVTCEEGKFTYKDAETDCHSCIDNGAECCIPDIPKATCRNQGVACGFGFTYNENLDLECTDCLDNAEPCCVQRTCQDTGTGKAAVCDAEGLKPKAGDTKCTLCMDNHDECCTKHDTCWTAKIVCPIGKYHKHPNLICAECPDKECEPKDTCCEETCCAEKTCENQGVCCNANLGFNKVSNFENTKCESCADNCEECCVYDTPTCKSANVGCGYGFHRKNSVADTACSTCALNDPVCCEPRTCGADLDIDQKYECPEGYDYLGDSIKCHFCEQSECCKPAIPDPTCRSENINCGIGMIFKQGSKDTTCSTCVQNDPNCCKPIKCNTKEGLCPATHKNKGDVLCALCSIEECCDIIPTCASEHVGCGFGFKLKGVEEQSDTCSTCVHNDPNCCAPLTCGSEEYECPDGFDDVDPSTKCAFCELSECCKPEVPEKTCSSQEVVCGHGYTKLPESEENSCGLCKMNHPQCCTKTVCTENICPEGFHIKSTDLQCGFCSVEECCHPDEPDMTCHNQQVGCGFGWKHKLDIDPKTTECSTCAHNDVLCCEPKTCGIDGPKNCGDHFKGEAPYTSKGAETKCSDCGVAQCCVAPVIQQTCVNQHVACSGHFDKHKNFMKKTCTNCVHNGKECCTPRTCLNQGVTCNADVYLKVEDYNDKLCLGCVNNELECCTPKMCGAHFFDADSECPAETHTPKSRRKPCVNCNQSECCKPKPTLKCAEIIIPHGQAFYSAPAGAGSERTKGSILSVECDLGYKFQDAEYVKSEDINNVDQDTSVVDYPICNPILIENLIEGHVEIFSPTTSGWNRAPPVCRPVTCPPLNIASIHTPDAPTKYDIGSVFYKDAQMDTIPMRGAGYAPRDYAGEADVVCNEGWIRVPNNCTVETTYYAKPYNTQGCNRASEEIESLEECQQAVNSLLQDSVLGSSLNGGERFGKTIQDSNEASYDNLPAKCSYREVDAQVIFNSEANGRAHTSLSPICKTNPTGSDLETVGCLPKCLSNGKWSVELPTCEKDWCNPIFQEWSCCKNRLTEKSQSYWLNHHGQTDTGCPVNYGDCDKDEDCSGEALCSQQRDLDNIDVCITDLDPCGGVKGATGTMCVVMTAVGVDYHANVESGVMHNFFFGGSILVLGSLAGYYMCREQKGEEYRALLEEEI